MVDGGKATARRVVKKRGRGREGERGQIQKAMARGDNPPCAKPIGARPRGSPIAIDRRRRCVEIDALARGLPLDSALAVCFSVG